MNGQQTSRADKKLRATSEILQVIRTSPIDVGKVFEAIAQNSVVLCDSLFANVFEFDGTDLRYMASHNVGPDYLELLAAKYPMQPDPSQVSGRVILTGQTVWVEDVAADPNYDQRFPSQMGWRRMLGVPMLQDETPIGTIVVGWSEPGPVDNDHEALLTTFSNQAAIALDIASQGKQLEDLNRTLEARVAEQVRELDRLGRLRRFLPRQLAEAIANSGDESILQSHRREVSVVFCDLRGFTAFSEIAEPEEVMSVLGDYHNIAGPLIDQHGGTLERFLGDGLMVLFNDPMRCDDPAAHAVRLSVVLRESMAEICSRWEAQGHQLSFGVGIAHGYATLGQIGFEGRMDYTAIGTVVNQAARLCDEARPGDILITQRVANLTEGFVEVEPIGELSLKGLRQRINGFRVKRFVS
ncbi:MAG: GAF domain-containing protein [Rhizobiales bacterium]|nr:GAF domain-containing protein [Hyphomicrobiales bacterium]